jgi:hypothetical protein
MSVRLLSQQLQFKLILEVRKDEDGKISGFKIISDKQGEAEWFCRTFEESLEQDKGSFFLVRPSSLELNNGVCPFQPARVQLALEEEDFRQLYENWKNIEGFRVMPMSPSTKGFNIHLAYKG